MTAATAHPGLRGHRLRIGCAVAVIPFVLSGCSTGPADIADGEYRAIAVSQEISTVPRADVAVESGALTFTTPAGSTTVTQTPGKQEFVVCPPSTRGTPALIGSELDVDGTTFRMPAVIGDCGQTTPERITLVDLASIGDDSAPFPFTRWIEFCDTSDPDC
jgi:hypothetical protein